MSQSVRTVEKEQDDIPSKIRFPTQSYTRDEFYKTTDNVRYHLALRFINGQQAEDVPIGIENLIELMGDIEMLINSKNGISLNFKNYDSWTTKLTCNETFLNKCNWKKLESEIEYIAEEHGIALKKSTGMSGRGYDDEGYRCVSINYSFGTYSENTKENIQNEYMSSCNVEWVGGNLGKREDLNPSTIKINSVSTVGKTELQFRKLKSYITNLFNLK